MNIFSGLHNIVNGLFTGTFSNKRLAEKKRYQFFNEMSILLSSGLDLKTALEICTEGDWKTNEKNTINSILAQIISGKDLWEALKDCGSFRPYEYQSIKIGESTGRINQILSELSEFIKKRIDQRKKITSAITYPCFVLFVAVLAVVFMLKFVVPMFKGVFEKFGGELPGITKLVIQASENIGKIIPYFIIFIFILLLIHYLFKKKDEYRRICSNLVLKLPLIGTILRKSLLSRFFLAFEILSSSRVSLITSLEILEGMFEFYPLQKSLQEIKPSLMKGTPLWVAFSKYPFFEKKIIALIRVGEEVNQLDLVLKTLREQYVRETDQKMEMISSFLEPVLILFLGGMVGIILVSMYLPLFKLSTSFSL